MKNRVFSLITSVFMSISFLSVMPTLDANAIWDPDNLTYGDYQYQILDDGTVEIEHYSGLDENLLIPSSIAGKTVTSIDYWTVFFEEGEECNIESITIPDSVVNIEYAAFEGCANLKTINIGSGVKSIGESSSNSLFSGCKALININVDPNNKTYASKDGVLYNKDLTELLVCPYAKKSLTIPSTVKKIDSNFDFSSCVNLEKISVDSENTSYKSVDGVLYNSKITTLIASPSKKTNVVIPNTVKKIENNAFTNSPISNIIIPNGVTKIGYAAFENCDNLTSITIPSSVTDIDWYAFNDCEKLKSVTLSNGIKNIGESAFYNCKKLQSVTIPKSVNKIGDMAFGYVKYEKQMSGFKIYCYSGSVGQKYAKEAGLSYEVLDARPAAATGFKVYL